MNIHQVFLAVLVISSHAATQSKGSLFQVRLVDGPSRYGGTVQYSVNGGRIWHYVCGGNILLAEVQVICRQLGFTGVSKNIHNSPFGNGSETALTGFNCAGGEASLEKCTMTTCSTSERQVGAAVCHDERYLGCFNDLPDSNVLPGNMLKSDRQTIESCIKYCMSSTVGGYIYAGLKSGDECYCGDASADYDSLARVGDDGCQYACRGDVYSSCGGNGKIAIFNLSVVIPPQRTETTLPTLPTLMSTDPTLTTIEDISSGRELTTILNTPTSTILPMFEHTVMSNAPSVSDDQSKIALYSGFGGGGAFLVILIIVIIIAFVYCKRRKVKRDTPASAQPMTFMCAEYKNTNEQEILYFDINDSNNRQQAAAIPDHTALYALPDFSGKTSSNKPEPCASPADDISLLYAMPDKHRETTNQRKGNQPAEGSDSTSTSIPTEPNAVELYAVPDMTRGDHVTRTGVGIQTPREGPDKQYCADDEVDNTVMIENEIYNC